MELGFGRFAAAIGLPGTRRGSHTDAAVPASPGACEAPRASGWSHLV